MAKIKLSPLDKEQHEKSMSTLKKLHDIQLKQDNTKPTAHLLNTHLSQSDKIIK